MENLLWADKIKNKVGIKGIIEGKDKSPNKVNKGKM